MDTVQSLGFFLPELILTGTLLLVIFFEFALKARKAQVAAWLTAIGAAMAALAALGDADKVPTLVFYGTAVVDPYLVFFRVFLSAVAVALVVFTTPHAADDGVIGRRGGEFYALLTATLLGGFLLVGAVHVVMVFVALELVSIPSYVMAGYFKDQKKGSEASVKYVIYGAFASGAMLYGFSLLYGLTGELDLYRIGAALRSTEPGLGMYAAVILVLAGVGYKISLVPFHFWAPDVYEGAPTPAAAFFSIGPKAAGVGLLLRLVWALGAGPLSEPTGAWIPAGGLDWSSLLAAFAVITMTLGNLGALFQTDLKRLIAYSGIAHAGYIVMGLAAFTGLAMQAVLVYLIAYYLANLAFFLIVDMVERESGSCAISSFRGLLWRSPVLGAGLIVALFSLTGLPPTIGFVGKWYLFMGLIQQKMYWLAVVGMANSVVSLWYYMRIVSTMWQGREEVSPAPLSVHPVQVTLFGLLTVLAALGVIYWGPLVDLARSASGIF